MILIILVHLFVFSVVSPNILHADGGQAGEDISLKDFPVGGQSECGTGSGGNGCDTLNVEIDLENWQMRATAAPEPLQICSQRPDDPEVCGSAQVNIWYEIVCPVTKWFKDRCDRESQGATRPKPDPPIINGPDVVTVDAVYTATGGLYNPPIADYSWSGVNVTMETNSDGSGTVTAIDSCMSSGRIDVIGDCDVLGSKDFSIYSPQTLSGPEAVAVGSVFTVVGGNPPFTWSVCGSHTVSGDTRSITIDDLSGCCGSGTVEVADACGQKEQMSVRFPSGEWVLVGNDPYWCYPGSNCFDPKPGCGIYFSSTVISGGIKTVYWYKRTYDCMQDYCGKSSLPKVCPGQQYPGGGTNNGATCVCLSNIEHFTWQCQGP